MLKLLNRPFANSLHPLGLPLLAFCDFLAVDDSESGIDIQEIQRMSGKVIYIID